MLAQFEPATIYLLDQVDYCIPVFNVNYIIIADLYYIFCDSDPSFWTKLKLACMLHYCRLLVAIGCNFIYMYICIYIYALYPS